jgi:hypothetical protein
MWLDELQRYLGRNGGLTAGTARALLAAGTVLVGTMWSDEYAIRVAPRRPGGDDHHVSDRELLDLAEVVDVAPVFSTAEYRRARGVTPLGRVS